MKFLMKKVVGLSGIFTMLMMCTMIAVGCSNGEDGKDGRDGKDGKDADALVEYPVQFLSLTKKDIGLRRVENDIVKTQSTETLYFNNDIPYIFVDDTYITTLNSSYSSNAYTISAVNADTKEITLTNTKRNATATFDLVHRRLVFSNYDAFLQHRDEVYYDLAGTFAYLKISDSSNVAGQPIVLSWATQDIGIGLYNENGTYKLAVPKQFLTDIFGTHPFFYNGTYIYLQSDVNKSTKLLEDYFDICSSKGTRSQSLAEYTYNELCLNLDFNYGLKAIHGIENFPDFDSYFKAQGIKTALTSTDAKIFTENLIDVVNFYFGDGHSAFNANSCWAGATRITGTKTSALEKKYRKDMTAYGKARAQTLSSTTGATYDEKTGISENVPAFMLSKDGKTAIVRFDVFTCLNFNTATDLETSRDALTKDNDKILKQYVCNEKEDSYKTVDTLSVIAAAHKKITDAGTVENVVLDLSRNGGGRITTAAYILAWMLGECTLNLTNPITGAKFSISYIADVDLNGTCGEESDTIKNKNLFCLISPNSFSCGNLTPSVLKDSDRVTILGVTSGGGACAVQKTSAADGTQFQISSKYVMSDNKNGSNYDMDRGVEPHYYINKPENFYDTEKIAALVTSINEAKLGTTK